MFSIKSCSLYRKDGAGLAPVLLLVLPVLLLPLKAVKSLSQILGRGQEELTRPVQLPLLLLPLPLLLPPLPLLLLLLIQILDPVQFLLPHMGAAGVSGFDHRIHIPHKEAIFIVCPSETYGLPLSSYEFVVVTINPPSNPIVIWGIFSRLLVQVPLQIRLSLDCHVGISSSFW